MRGLLELKLKSRDVQISKEHNEWVFNNEDGDPVDFYPCAVYTLEAAIEEFEEGCE